MLSLCFPLCSQTVSVCLSVTSSQKKNLVLRKTSKPSYMHASMLGELALLVQFLLSHAMM